MLGYKREENGETFVVILNLGHEPVRETLPEDLAKGRIVLSTFLDRENEPADGAIDLRGDEGVLIVLSR